MRTVGELLMQSPTSPVKETQLQTGTNKKWAEQYHFIKNIITHTRVENGCAVADFQAAFLPPYADDALRMSAPAVSPNERQWRLQTEADCELWFHSEISNVVLAAWSQYPALTQTSHSKPMGDKAVAEEIDATYAFRSRHHKVALAIGEMKRNLINPGPWQRGNISMDMTQKRLSKELRGYADKYECPQVFCFDGETLVLLQFRANTPGEIREEGCPVDCWVLPRTKSTTTLRYAFYMLLVQGLRRFQGSLAQPPTVGRHSSHFRQFYNGCPLWKDGNLNSPRHPDEYERSVDTDTGEMIWTHPIDPNPVRETLPIWGPEAVL
ncbi:hypothetical protein RJ55_02113 [Drechmeria coniospora]|nr:hypothetical protein RJ55_02113 [Drechmeria coniospora]